MKTSTVSFLARAGALGLAAALAGCGSSPPTTFHVVTSLDRGERAAADGPAVGVGPLVVAGYLDRPQIATRSDENTLELAEFHQWAEPLKQSLHRLLVENLSVLLGSDEVAALPWRSRAPMDFQVSVEIDRFDRAPDGQIALAARWLLLDVRAEPASEAHRSWIRRPAAGDDHGVLAAAMSKAWADLSREIAAAIEARRR